MQQVFSGRFSLQRRRLVMALPLLGAGAWSAGSWAGVVAQSAPYLRTSHALMGTQVDVAVAGGESAALQRATLLAVAEMRRLESLLSRYREDSVVARLGVASGVAPVPVPPEAMSVLRSAQQLAQASDGAFDVTVGALKAWDFAEKRVPSPRQIAQQLPLVGASGLVLDARAGTAYLARRGMALDLGGIAKLPILEAGMHVLRAQGVHDAMINGGGDVLTQGTWQGRPWRIGLRDPRAPERLLGVVEAEGACVVASSGDYERFFFRGGERLHHVLNPRTGRPTAGVHGVSLIARDVAAVNGLGAALMVQGLPAAQALAARRPELPVLVAGQDGTVWQSPAMAARLKPIAA